MTTMLRITCRDPIVSRDGRPFGAHQGNRMRSLGWVLPSMLAGSLRTALGASAEQDFTLANAEKLLRVEVAGPFPVSKKGQLYYPAPDDCVVHPEKGLFRAAPQLLDAGGGDWPADLQPVRLRDDQAPEDFKPAPAPAWWPEKRMAAWLAGDKITFDQEYLCSPERVERTHVVIDSLLGTAKDEALFTTAALTLNYLPRYQAKANQAFSERFAEIALAVRVRAAGWCGDEAAKLDTLHPLGGERRLVHWQATADGSVWSCPQKVSEALGAARRVRMVLATPAIFRCGWKPGWLGHDLVGAPPGAAVRLRLIGVTIQRWRAVSGWSLTELPARAGRPKQPRGPKPVRRIVPAGGVYFFETVEGNASALADRWLESVSDDEQDRRDGFGLAIWGVW